MTVPAAPSCGATMLDGDRVTGECGRPAPTHSVTFSGSEVIARTVPLCDEHYAALKAMQEAGDAPPPRPSDG